MALPVYENDLGSRGVVLFSQSADVHIILDDAGQRDRRNLSDLH